MMETLFSPFQLSGLELKNRIVMPPIASFLIKDDGGVTDETVEHYRRRAAGGPAMVIMEACSVAPEGVVSPYQARIHDDRHVEGLARIAAVMKHEGAVPAVQLHHGGRQISHKVIKRKPVAPSPLPCPAIKGDVEPLTKEGVQDLVVKFGQAARRAVEAGFELIEIHGAHGYLINQFLSRFSNIRTDEYGGDVAGRARFAREIVAEIRRRLGDDFPLSFKISAQEFCPNGLTPEESIELLKPIVASGVNAVQVSAGNDATPEWIAQPILMKPACLADSAHQVKQALNIPVMTVGRINNPLLADDLIAQGKADLVCIGRGLLADPELPRKAREGRLEDIRVCIACNTCMESIFRKGRIECLVNPSLGREKEMAILPAQKKRKVAVIGGGPGGLNTAWVAASRGHDVHLFEKTGDLGGRIIMGSVIDYKKELLNLVHYQKRQVEKYGVKCHLNTPVTAETIRELAPDVVVAATGASPLTPKIEGVDKPLVEPYTHILNGRPAPPKKTVVIGGGATGCETAYHLSTLGSEVTIVEPLPKVGESLESMVRRVLLQRLAERGVTIMTETTPQRIEDQGVWVANAQGEDVFLEAERVVTAVGNRSEDELCRALEEMGLPIHRLGDCLQPRTAKAAIYEGAVLGRTI